MKRALALLIRRLDQRLAPAYLRLRAESDGLVILLFHTLLPAGEKADGVLHPQQATTVDDLRRVVEHLLVHGYRFVPLGAESPAAGGRRAALSFDDGYYNNLLALDVLREYDVPALFCISTNHVRQQRAFWWDVVYRERRRRSTGAAAIEREIRWLKGFTHEGIEEHLRREFGAANLRPAGDLDRPFRPHELREFAADRRVVLGNHTADHAILTLYRPEAARQQIAAAQAALHEMAGAAAPVIAYPNGSHSPAVRRAAREAGLELGLTLEPRKNRSGRPSRAEERLRLGRFLVWGGPDVARQCDAFRADFTLERALRAALPRGREV